MEQFVQLLRCHPWGSSLPWQPEESSLSIASDFQPHSTPIPPPEAEPSPMAAWALGMSQAQVPLDGWASCLQRSQLGFTASHLPCFLRACSAHSSLALGSP